MESLLRWNVTLELRNKLRASEINNLFAQTRWNFKSEEQRAETFNLPIYPLNINVCETWQLKPARRKYITLTYA